MARENPDITMPSLVKFSSCEDDGENDDATQKKSNVRMNRGIEDHTNKFRSNIRSKFLLEAVRQELLDLQRENEMLRIIVREHIRPLDLAEEILAQAEAPPVDIYLKSSILMDDEDQFVEEEKPNLSPKDSPNNKKDFSTRRHTLQRGNSAPKGEMSVRKHTLERMSSAPSLISEKDGEENDIPKVLTLPKMRKATSERRMSRIRNMKAKTHTEEKKVNETDFHFGTTSNLAAALSGEYAF